MGNDKAQKRKVQITSIITLFVFLLDIYLIIYVPIDYILIVAAFITLVFALFTMGSWFKLREIDNKRREEQYADIMKAQKGTYVISLEMLKQLDEKINFIGQKIMPLSKAGDINQRKIASMLDGIVEDQKKIAKITISRNKENADALMNSNDRLYNQMTEFRDSIENIRNQIARQVESGSQETEGFGEIKDELFGRIEELTESIKHEMDEIASHSSTPEIKMTMTEMVEPQAEAVIPEVEVPEPKMFTPEMEAAQPEIPKTKVEPVVAEMKPTVVPEVKPDITPKAPEPEIDPNRPMTPEEIAALIANTSAEELPEEPMKIMEEEKPPMPDMSDPNKLMSPEDIAALIANM